MIEDKYVDLYARNSGLRDKVVAERDIVLTYALRPGKPLRRSRVGHRAGGCKGAPAPTQGQHPVRRQIPLRRPVLSAGRVVDWTYLVADVHGEALNCEYEPTGAAACRGIQAT